MCPEIGGDQPLKILGIFSCNHTDVLITQIAAMHQNISFLPIFS